MPDPPPVRPRVIDANAYNQVLREGMLKPLFRSLSAGLERAATAADAYEELRRRAPPPDYADDTIRSTVDVQAARMDDYHRARTIATFQRALTVDVASVLNDAETRVWMNGWRVHNVSLIKTIPQRAHERLYARMTDQFAKAPFDRYSLKRLLSSEFRSSGYNLRRLTRDQTNKAIGNLTHIRQVQLGVSWYRWRTSKDERVRRTHRVLEGSLQRWDHEPSEGHPGYAVQCRCTAQAVISVVSPYQDTMVGARRS